MAPLGPSTHPAKIESPHGSGRALETGDRSSVYVPDAIPRVSATPNWPSPRDTHAMVYHATLARVFLFGGLTESGANNETWLLDPSNSVWELVATDVTPPARFGHAMAFDKSTGLVVMFGGRALPLQPFIEPVLHETGLHDVAVEDVLNDTWVYDVADGWREVRPNGSPSPREGPVMVHDEALGRNVLFGGRTEGGEWPDDTWSYDAAVEAWADLSPRAPPDGGASPRALAYHAASGRIIMLVQGEPYLQTWAYDSTSNAWARRNATVVPGLRLSTALVDYPESGGLLLFGGDRLGHADGFGAVPDLLFHHADTWTYDVASDTWTEMTRLPSPGDLAGHAMAYDSASRRVFLFGGILGSCPYPDDELWSYDSAGGWTGTDHRIVPSAPTHVSWTTGDGETTLTWRPPRLDGRSSIVGYRIQWMNLEDPAVRGNLSVVQAGNVLTYTHRGLVNGDRYQYQVVALNAEGEGELSCPVRAYLPPMPTTGPIPHALDMRILGAAVASAIVMTSVVVLGLWRRRRKGGARRRVAWPFWK